MDLKRNYASNIQPPSSIKTSTLLNPLITISNASTPVRTRVVKPGSQLNSTPVNVHKIGMHVRSPVLPNKENDQGNKLAIKRTKPGEHNLNINLSPIMALNRKNSDMPKPEPRAQTPTGFKREGILANMLQQNKNENQWGTKPEQYSQNLQQSRNSNSFRSMLDSRSKTPTRAAFAQTLQRQSSQPNNLVLRTSGSANSLLQGMNKLRQSRNLKIVESRSFEQITSLGTPVARGNEVLCSNSNQHQKKVKAKYKVVEEPDDDELLVYCSKCAINLVQKGFKVEDLTSDDINRIRQTQQQGKPSQMQRSSNQYHDYAEETNRKLEIKLNQLIYQKQSLVSAYQKELDDVDCYYNSIATLIEQQKKRDRDAILRNLQKERRAGEHLHKRLLDASGQMGYLLRNGVGHSQLNVIQEIECLLAEKGFGCRFDGSKCLADNIQHKFQLFSRFFQTEGRLRIEADQKDEEQGSNTFTRFNSRKQSKQQCPLRFSFQKNIKQSKKSPFVFRKNMMNALQQAPESMEGEDSRQIAEDCEKKPFRTLFPEDEQQSPRDQAEQKQAIHSPTFKQI